MQKGGVPKETLTSIAMISLPIGIATQSYVSRFFGESKPGIPPLVIFLTGWKVRLANGLLLMLLILSLSTATEGGGAIPLWVYGFGVGVTVLSSIASSAMFVAQMAFFNRVSDPKIGGTYMTILNTVSNLGAKWMESATLFAIDLVSDKVCVASNDPRRVLGSCATETLRASCAQTI